MKNILVLFALSIFILVGCKNEPAKSDYTPPAAPDSYAAALAKLKSEPGKASAQNFISETRKALVGSADMEMNKDYLIKGLNVAEEYKMGPTAIGFLMPLLRDFDEPATREENLAKLASALQDIGKSVPGDILAKAYAVSYPNGKYLSSLKTKMKNPVNDPDAYIKTQAEAVFENPDQYGINRVAAQRYVDACEAYAIGFPNEKMAVNYLYKASEMARTLKTYPKALSIYEWIENKYPDFEKTPTVMFLKGFMLENELKDKDAAKKVYTDFLAKYKESPLRDDVEFLLNNIDKSEEEILKLIEKKQEQ